MSAGAATQTSAPPAAGTHVAFLERVLFFVLLALICARPLISESFERLELGFLPRSTIGTTPATSVWLDSLTASAAVGVLVKNWGRRRGGGWVLVGLGALMLAVALSVAWAGEQRLALNAGFSLVIAALAGAALVQLMRAPWMPRLLLAAILASGAVMATKCALWKAYEHRDTLETWAEYKPQLEAAGQDLSAPSVINFERRLQSGEAIGYQSHPNVTGSYLAMWLLAAAGIGAAWLAAGRSGAPVDRAAAVLFSFALVVLLGFGLRYTRSLGACVALAGGLAVLVALGCLARRVAARPRQTVAVLAVAYLAVIAAATGYGLVHGGFAHPSLAFRWQYWTAGMEAFWDAPLTGAGRLNFADAYMRHKLAISPEEVRDPHNLWVLLLVELGPLGLAAGVVLVAGSIAAVLRRLDGGLDRSSAQPAVSLLQVVAALIAVPLAHLLFSGRVESWPTAVLWAMEVGAVWSLAFVVLVRLVDLLPDSDAARGWLLAGIAAALLAALIHSLIDFALLTAGGLYLFVGLLAAAIALRPPQSAGEFRPGRAWLPAVAGVLLVFLHLSGVTLPTTRTEFRLQQLRRAAFAGGPTTHEALRRLEQRVLASDPLDADAAREVASLALMGAQATDTPEERLELLKQAEQVAQTALERNPNSRAAEVRLGKVYQDMREAYLLAVRPDESMEALRQAALHWQKAVELYPTDPRTRISAGKVWVEWWEESDDPTAARTALGHFEAALEIDAVRSPVEVMRLRPAEREEIDSYLRGLQQ